MTLRNTLNFTTDPFCISSCRNFFLSQLIPPRSYSIQIVNQYQLEHKQPSQSRLATGDELTFQWQKNSHNLKCGRNYIGTDTNTLKIRQVKKSDAGCYRCLVKNEVKSEGEISEEAELNVCKCLSMCNCGDLL